MIGGKEIVFGLLVLALLPIIIVAIHHYLWICRIVSSRVGTRKAKVPKKWGRLMQFYGLIFFLTALMIALARYWAFTILIQDLILLVIVVPLIVFDFRYYLLPNTLTQALLWSGILLSLLGAQSITLEESLWGIIAGYLLMYGVYSAGYWFYRHEVLGFGDVKFVAGLSAWIGIDLLLPFLLTSSLLGIIGFFVLAVIARFSTPKSGVSDNHPLQSVLGRAIAFGPYLGVSGIISYFMARLSGI